MLASNVGTSTCFAIFELIIFACSAIFELIIFELNVPLPHRELLIPGPPRIRNKHNPLQPHSKFNPHPPRNLTHSSAGSRWSPARGGLSRAGCGYPHLRGWCGNPHCFACGCGFAAGRARVVLTAGAGRARDVKLFVRVNQCWAKAHELNQLKNRKTRGFTKVVCQHCA